jgi:hypothetical protein
VFTALNGLNLWGTRIPLCNSKREKSVWAMDGGSFQGDEVFLLSAQLHMCAALVEEWKPRENTYIYYYLYTKT